jgi:glycosyltransferase involved in cell wall biosynthesis
MKIVFFATRFAFEYSIELANSVLKQDSVKEVFLFLPGNNISKAQEKQISKDIKFIPFSLPGNKKVYASLTSMRTVVNQIKDINPDILHIQGSGDPYFWLFYHKIKKIPIIDTIHDAKPHPGFESFLKKFMISRATKNVKKWFIHGNILKDEFVKLHSIRHNDVLVIPKGHYGIFKNYTDEMFDEDEMNIVFFGNITKYKGINVLLDSVNPVIEKFPNAKFTIAGRTRKKDADSIDLSYLSNNKNFVLKNYRLTDKEVADLYQKATIIVLPYIEASQSGVLSIAFGFGKAIIATKVGALPEIIENNKTGILIESNNSEQLAEAIIKLLDNKSIRKELGTNALEYANAELSWDNIANMVVEVYQKVY